MVIITPAIKYPKAVIPAPFVIPAKAGIYGINSSAIQIFQALIDSVAIPSTCGRVIIFLIMAIKMAIINKNISNALAL